MVFHGFPSISMASSVRNGGEEPAPGTPSVPVTPITSRKPTPQKPVPEARHEA